MPITGTNITSGTGIISGTATTNVLTVANGGAGVGDLVVVLCGSSGSGHTYSFTDNSTGGPNTWTAIPIMLTGIGSTVEIGYSFLTHALANGNTITGTVNTGTPGGRMIYAQKYNAADLAGTVDPTTLSNDVIQNTTAPGPVALGANTVNAANLVVCCGWLRNATGAVSLTQDAAWDSVVIQDHTGTTTCHQFLADLTTSSVSNPSISPTSSTAGDDWGFGMVAFPAAGGGGGGPTLRELMMLGVGV